MDIRNHLASSTHHTPITRKSTLAMSVIIDSLKKQNTFLQGEVERFANAVDNLAQQLSEALDRLKQYEPELEQEPDETDPA